MSDIETQLRLDHISERTEPHTVIIDLRNRIENIKLMADYYATHARADESTLRITLKQISSMASKCQTPWIKP